MYNVSFGGFGVPAPAWITMALKPAPIPVKGKCPEGFTYVAPSPIPGTRGMYPARCAAVAKQPTGSSVISPRLKPPLSAKPKIVDGIVTCPEGTYAYTPRGSLASCISQGVSTPAMLPCAEGSKLVCKEVAEGVRCDCEPIQVVPMIGADGEVTEEEIVAVTAEKKKKGLPTWAWLAIAAGGGVVVGGLVVLAVKKK
jgi:hypothetical protein